MKECNNTHCRKLIPNSAGHCPFCGKEQAAVSRPAWPFFLIGVTLWFLMGVMILAELDTSTLSRNLFVLPTVNEEAPQATATRRTATPTRTRIPPTRTLRPFTRTPLPPSPTTIVVSTSCPGAPATRIAVNDLIRVITTNRDRLVLRSLPEITDSSELRRLNMGTEMKVFSGPVCVQDPDTSQSYWFWEVRLKNERNVFGWVAEGDRTLYFVENIR